MDNIRFSAFLQELKSGGSWGTRRVCDDVRDSEHWVQHETELRALTLERVDERSQIRGPLLAELSRLG